MRNSEGGYLTVALLLHLEDVVGTTNKVPVGGLTALDLNPLHREIDREMGSPFCNTCPKSATQVWPIMWTKWIQQNE
ncbi:hypothetical protein DPEC_G00075570 [Dallia pectoralis]|uniref:Uncharacterized protein n=1 Tax=Dallia pectoralis TaxID=75939 RepID=A0ACC2H3Z0_DALPE|nr:hypothetical protein DPEC_G00075570 [Dallia pectoralis]